MKRARGYRGGRGRLYETAAVAVMRSGQFAYRDRRAKKRSFRRLWIARINAAARQHGMSYSTLMDGLRRACIELDRKVLADLALRDAGGFGELVRQAQAARGSVAAAAGD